MNYLKIPDIWFISDTHFSHDNILKFQTHNDKKVREGFKDVHEMDETMIRNWNNVVKPEHKIYHLGDVCFRNVARMHEIMPRLMGKKRLVLGNHDHYKIAEYERYFRIEPCWRQFKDFAKPFICTHVPVHPRTLTEGRFKEVDGTSKQVYNVHGHIHEQRVMIDHANGRSSSMPDDRYVTVCVEHINYTPIHVEELMRLMK